MSNVVSITAPWAIWTVNDEEYKLKLKISEIERLERMYGQGNLMNPMMAGERGALPSLVYMIDIIHASLQKYHHGYSREATVALVDRYFDKDGSQTDLLQLIMEVFKVSGFFPKEKQVPNAEQESHQE